MSKRWISKHPPIYIHADDIWVREPDYTTFRVHSFERAWVSESDPTLIIPFPNKCTLPGVGVILNPGWKVNLRDPDNG